MARFLPTREICRVINAVASAAVPEGFAVTLPCPTDARSVTLRSVFYRVRGVPPAPPVVYPPTYVVDIEGTTACVLRLARCTPDEVGFVPPISSIAGAGINRSEPMEQFLGRRERVYDLAPTVWDAYTLGRGALGTPPTEAREFLGLLLTITLAEVAPFYPAVTPDFMRWLGATAAP